MSTRSAMRRDLVVLALAAAVTGCGSSASSSGSGSTSSAPSSGTSGSSAPSPSASSSVAIAGYAYKPPSITVSSGARITFTNHDATAHTATTKGPGFDTGTLKPGESKTVTVKTSGTYSYYCQFHPFMIGTVIVK